MDKDLDALLEKHKIKGAIVLLEYPEPQAFRVLAVSNEKDYAECNFAKLFEGCVNVSPGLRKILDHASTHGITEILHEALKHEQIKKKGKKVD